MNSTTKTAVFTSVAFLLFFGFKIQKIMTSELLPNPQMLAPIQLPFVSILKKTNREELLKGQPEGKNPFKPLFCEVMNLYGVRKTFKDQWVALFSGMASEVVPLTIGDSFEGVTIISTDSKGCTVRYGNIERTFNLQNSNVRENIKRESGK
ncbi:MAG: hypothetical protein HQM08_18350 [Candidatus Riflebacteria bacterium]|nr:hypothetical protein [Candidatus Riflebacteria bacterium]